MLDPDEFAAYEAWRAKRITGEVDVSVQTFNAERESLALQWEHGARYGIDASADPTSVGETELSSKQKLTATVLSRNPNRKPGMLGELPVSETKRVIE